MVKIYCDSADIQEMLSLKVDGYTTNPTLMRKAGITEYSAFAKAILKVIDKPISFEVFSDDFEDMERQARLISSWGQNVYVKIPITNTKGEFSGKLIRRLNGDGIKVNVTAVFTRNQVQDVARHLTESSAIISVFCGRIMDTGEYPPYVGDIIPKNVELLWASTRELFNIKQAEEDGYNIITVTPDLLKKMSLFGKDLGKYSLETVQMFYNDAKEAGYRL